MNQGWIYREQVKRSSAGQTVLDYYCDRYRHSSREEWGDRIQSGQILVDGQVPHPDQRLHPGQWLAYHRPPWEEPEVPLSIKILHDDPELLVVAKPAGLPVLPGAGFLEHTLLGQLRYRYPQDTPIPIHRLGRGTSGLMLLARSPRARAHLSQQMRDRQIRKTYRALVGPGTPDFFTMTYPIGKLPHPVLGYVYGAMDTGMVAYSEARVVTRHAETTLLDVTILTGRPHQIRIHLAAAGYPLVGDPLYAPGGTPRIKGQDATKLPVPGDIGYHLHASYLEFVHPSTAAPMPFTCPAPPPLHS